MQRQQYFICIGYHLAVPDPSGRRMKAYYVSGPYDGYEVRVCYLDRVGYLGDGSAEDRQLLHVYIPNLMPGSRYRFVPRHTVHATRAAAEHECALLLLSVLP